MKLRNIVSGLVIASMFAGCSIFDRKPVDYKAGAVQTPSLEVPPDLTVPETEQRYLIPGEKAASYSEYAKKKTEQPCVPVPNAPVAAVPATTVTPVPTDTPIVAVTPTTAPSATMHESKGIKSILLGEPFDRSWRRVGLALDHAQLVTSDKDRNKGTYFVAPIPDKDSKQKQPDYQVIVREKANGSEVTVVDQNGKSDAAAAKLVEAIYQNLDKNDRGNGRRPARGDAVRSSR